MRVKGLVLGVLALGLAGWMSMGCNIPGLSPTQAPAEAGPGEVAFELAGPGGAVLVVPVRINGKGPYNFVLDTGATLTCIDETLARELALPETPGVIGTGVGIGAEGSMQVVDIESVEVGTARATDLSGCVLDLGHIQSAGIDMHGLLGLNFLKAYRVTIDFERQVLRLDRPAAS